jgi:hypothetical protein
MRQDLRMRRLLLAAVATAVLTGALFASAAPAATTVAERRAAAKTVIRLTFAYARGRDRVDADARRAARERRAAAQRCLPVWASVPKHHIEKAGEIYFTSVAGALWSVDGPLTDRWIDRLEGARSVMRVPVLAAAMRGMRRTLPLFERSLNAFPDPCATVTAWRDAGWSAAAAPDRFPGVDLEAATKVADAAERAINRGAALVRRYGGPAGANAASLFSGALDEVDSRVIDSCDPVAQIVLPDNVDTCTDDG